MSKLDDVRFRIKVQEEVVRIAKDKDAKFLAEERSLIEELGKETFCIIEHKLHMAIFDEEAKLRELKKEEEDILYHSK